MKTIIGSKVILSQRNWVNVIARWRHKGAADYVKKLVQQFGDPAWAAADKVMFGPFVGFDFTYVKDESIPHDFPMPHQDFVYSWKKIGMAPTPKHAALLTAASPSLFWDGLLKMAGARCGAILKNAISIGFIEDVFSDRLDDSSLAESKQEYGKRIKVGEIPGWFRDQLGEG